MKNKIIEIRTISENLIAFKDQNNLWGFVDNEGKVVIKPKYRKVSDFYHGISIVYTDKDCYLIDRNGKKISKSYSKIDDFHDGLAVVSKNKLLIKGPEYGYIDIYGREVIPCRYKNASQYKDKKCLVTNKDNIEYNIHYDSKIVDNKENVKIVDNYFIIKDGEYEGIENDKGEIIFPLGDHKIKIIGDNLFYISKIDESILFDASIKNNINNIGVSDIRNNLFDELKRKEDFILIRKNNENSIFDNYYLVSKENLKVRIIPADIIIFENNIGHINENVKDFIKYLDFSNISFDNIDVTYTNFLGSNARINPQTIYNKDLSGVKISATNIIYDELEPNYEGVITDSNTEIIGEYIDYKNQKKLIRKL